MSVSVDLTARLRPVAEPDLVMLRRFCTEPGLIGLDWAGFRDAGAPARRFAVDGYLGGDDGRLVVEVEQEQAAAGIVSYTAGRYAGRASYWEIGIVLLPQWRGRGVGWRAQALLCDYLFQHSPAQRIQAGTHPENVAEQRALEKAGFQLYSRLLSPAPSEVEISVRQPPSRGPVARPGTTTEAAVSAGSREMVTGAVVITALRSASADSGPVP
ncbi:GNAT family protein [Micromonospora sp. NPDC005324]|uniref:GNAT family N-acetyltransferase n=1 Tax=Micromonospora sp. NPDC005324 TaxID=3157033 RepID=UPI0033AD6E9A